MSRYHAVGGEDDGDETSNLHVSTQEPGEDELDDFFCRVYEYYEGKGFWRILLEYLTNILSIAFVIAFATVLLVCINYKGIVSDLDARPSEPVALRNYVGAYGVSLPVGICLAFALVFWVCYCIFAMARLRRLAVSRSYYRDLNISDWKLGTMKWDDVVEKIRTRQLVATGRQRLSALYIAHCIMRRDNFLLAFYYNNIVDLTFPFPGLRERPLFTRSTEWIVRHVVDHCIFNRSAGDAPSLATAVWSFLFPTQQRVFRPDIWRKAQVVNEVRRRFWLIGIINCVLAPIIFIFLIIFAFFKYADEVHKKPSAVGRRVWSRWAHWVFRGYNELPHAFEARLNTSYKSATEYVEQFPGGLETVLAKFVAFIAGSFMAVFLLMGVLDDRVLLNLEITHGQSLVWYVGAAGAVLAISRAFIPAPHTVFEPDVKLNAVKAAVTFIPKWSKWVEQGLHSHETFTSFSQLYELRVGSLLLELASVLFTPLLCWFKFAPRAEAMVDFFIEKKLHVPGLGDVCSLAYWEDGPVGTQGATALSPTGASLGQSVFQAARSVYNPHSLGDVYGANTIAMDPQGVKAGWSCINFKINHPNWRADAETEQLFSQWREGPAESALFEGPPAGGPVSPPAESQSVWLTAPKAGAQLAPSFFSKWQSLTEHGGGGMAAPTRPSYVPMPDTPAAFGPAITPPFDLTGGGFPEEAGGDLEMRPLHSPHEYEPPVVPPIGPRSADHGPAEPNTESGARRAPPSIILE